VVSFHTPPVSDPQKLVKLKITYLLLVYVADINVSGKNMNTITKTETLSESGLMVLDFAHHPAF
jgi:hypothetical protein